MSNPLASNPLTDILPPRVRLYVYAVLFLAFLGVSAWQASDGNWVNFVVALVTALGHGTAASNVKAPKK